MNPTSDADRECLDRWQVRLLGLGRAIRSALVGSMATQSTAELSRVERDDSADGDSIFAIDVDAERILLEHCERWAAEEQAFTLVAEGIEPSTGRPFGSGPPQWRVIVDPIDGTRGLMFDKRSAWFLAAVAPEASAGSPPPTLTEIALSVMTELGTTRQRYVDTLWARRDGSPTRGQRHDLAHGTDTPILRVSPSTAIDLRHGFATVCSFFQGGKELIARIDEDLIGRALGGWRHDKAEVYSDHYISSGGQLAELALGRDRFVLDIRPQVHRALGYDTTLCSRPYDLCTLLVAEQAGCVITAPDGSALDAPLDTTTNLGWVGYANQELAARMQPIVTAVLRDHGVID